MRYFELFMAIVWSLSRSIYWISMQTAKEFMDHLSIETPKFDHELYQIGHLATPEAKSRAVRGRFDLAVNALVTWDKLQIELRGLPGLESVRNLMYDELKEVGEKSKVEHELVFLKDKHLPWYERERARDYWAVANEMADVLVLLVGGMREDGLNDTQVMDALVGRAAHNEKPLINEMIARTSALGMDLAEVMIYKTEINLQHRDPTLLAHIRGDGFMKKIRKSIGDSSSQIPHLAQGFLGETVLTKLQSPRLLPPPTERLDLFNLDAAFEQVFAQVAYARMSAAPEGIFAVS